MNRDKEKKNVEKTQDGSISLIQSELSSNKHSLMPYILGIILAAAVLFIVRWGFLCPGSEYEPDCFFHARIVEEGPSVFLSKKFPTLACSTWTESYSDKELIFHIMLWGISKIGKFLGASNEYPFNYQVMFFDILVISAFSLLLYRKRIRYPWIYTLLLVSVYPPMTYRLISLRAYLLSMAISATVMMLMMDDSFRKWRWRHAVTCAMGCLAGWSYSSPHLILTAIVPFAIAEYVSTKKLSSIVTAPAAFVAGIILALTLHPQFPNTYLMFKVQCIDVIMAFFLDLEKIPIAGGNEFYASTLKLMATHYFTYPAMILLTAFLLIKNRTVFFGQNWKDNVSFNGLVLAAAMNIICAIIFFRFNEYALIPTCMLFAVTADKVRSMSAKESNKAKAERPWIPAVLLSLACVIAMFYYTSRLPYEGMGELPSFGVAQWAEDTGIPEGTVIGNAMWSSFPGLYYAMPKYRFSWGLDPAFTWKHTPELLRLVGDARQGIPHTPAEFSKAYRSRYLYVHLLEGVFAEYFWKNGFIPVYQNWDGWVFDLSLPQRIVTENTPELQFLDLVKQGKAAPFVMQFCIDQLSKMYIKNPQK